MPMSAMKARFQIAECSPLYQQRRTGRFSKKITSIFLGKPLSFSIQKDFQSPSAPHASYPFPKD